MTMKMTATIVEIERVGKTCQLVLNVELVPESSSDTRNLSEMAEGDLLEIPDMVVVLAGTPGSSGLPS